MDSSLYDSSSLKDLYLSSEGRLRLELYSSTDHAFCPPEVLTLTSGDLAMFDRGLVTAIACGHFNPILLQSRKLDNSPLPKYTNLEFQVGSNRGAPY